MVSVLKKELEFAFKNIRIVISGDDRLTITAQKDAVLTIMSFLKKKGYGHLALISCTDWIKENEFELVYIITSYGEKINIILKTRIFRENPQFITVIPVFENAEPYERELHELFGINFEGHPRLTPLFLEREYNVPPFRKDFDTRKYVEEFFDKIPTVEEKSNEAT